MRSCCIAASSSRIFSPVSIRVPKRTTWNAIWNGREPSRSRSTVAGTVAEYYGLTELTDISVTRQAENVRTRVENSHGILKDCFQQSVVQLAQMFDTEVDGQSIFPDFHAKLEQSRQLSRQRQGLIGAQQRPGRMGADLIAHGDGHPLTREHHRHRGARLKLRDAPVHLDVSAAGPFRRARHRRRPGRSRDRRGFAARG